MPTDWRPVWLGRRVRNATEWGWRRPAQPPRRLVAKGPAGRGPATRAASAARAARPRGPHQQVRPETALPARGSLRGPALVGPAGEESNPAGPAAAARRRTWLAWGPAAPARRPSRRLQPVQRPRARWGRCAESTPAHGRPDNGRTNQPPCPALAAASCIVGNQVSVPWVGSLAASIVFCCKTSGEGCRRNSPSVYIVHPNFR